MRRHAEGKSLTKTAARRDHIYEAGNLARAEMEEAGEQALETYVKNDLPCDTAQGGLFCAAVCHSFLTDKWSHGGSCN